MFVCVYSILKRILLRSHTFRINPSLYFHYRNTYLNAMQIAQNDGSFCMVSFTTTGSIDTIPSICICNIQHLFSFTTIKTLMLCFDKFCVMYVMLCEYRGFYGIQHNSYPSVCLIIFLAYTYFQFLCQRQLWITQFISLYIEDTNNSIKIVMLWIYF